MDPFLGEIRMFGGNFAPQGWALCNGALLDIATNDALFNLIGTSYGGDGVNNFGLPDLRGRLPVHQGTGQSTYTLGQSGGAETVTVTTSQLPTHTHTLLAISTGQVASPAGVLPAVAASTQAGIQVYGPAGGNPTHFNPAIIQNSDVGGLPHDNFQPYLCINFIIALQGIYPSQN